MAGRLAGAVLLVDGYEQLGPIDGWLRQAFLPSLPADALVVLAGRDAPAPPWRTDPGWRSVVAVHRLDHFDAAESDELLALAGVAPPVRARLVRLGRGHPLAMALLADVAVTGTVPDSLGEVPDLVSALLEALLPRYAQRRPHVRAGRLHHRLADHRGPAPQGGGRRRASGVGLAGAAAVHRQRAPWAWPHDLARDVLDAEFERRSPERYRSLHRVVDHVVTGLRAAAGLDRQLLAQHLLYLAEPLTRAFYAARQGSAAVVPRRDEHAQVLSIMEGFEGGASARLFEAWLAEQPDTLSVIRDRRSGRLRLPRPAPDRLGAGGPRPGHPGRAGPRGQARPGARAERVDIARFFAGRRAQRDQYAVLAGSVSSLVEWVSRPLAWTFVVVVDDDYWGPYFDYLAFSRLFEVDVGGVTRVAYGNDWRRFPMDTWLDLMNEREHAGGGGPPPAPCCAAAAGPARFAAAVRAALADLRRPDRLAASPLAGLVAGRRAWRPAADQLRAPSSA